MRALPIGLFAMALAAAGLPLYIHLPRYAEVDLGLNLSAVGAILLGIRVLDFVQDPALGWMVDRFPHRKRLFVALAVAGLAIGFVALFSVPPLVAPVLWLIIVLAVVFTAFSLATILFYGQTRALSDGDTPTAMIDVAKWRESGSLVGIIIAASLPIWLGYTAFGLVMMALVVLVGFLSRPLWSVATTPEQKLQFKDLYASGGGGLLALTFVNSLPVAITSTLFVFFVEDRLILPDAAGPYLILFFLAAAVSIPVWTKVANVIGPRATLVIAMGLAIASFGWAASLGSGEALAFGIICIGSGFAAGADMLILPALFSSTLARSGLQTGQAFGFWSFANKMTLAIAAGLVLPILDRQGFQSDTDNSPEALATLTLLYAIIPCGLKVLAIGITLTLPKKTFQT
ncbi:MFS transporter [Cognatishimia sp.]|uniref:MFS transporter n=1 Tax=Cognatishimia sp. TaxID=2211648 RepID=UPI003512F044